MADGRAPYSTNALSAVSGVPTCGPKGCPACQKVGLPVLLVRPGVAETNYADAGGRQSKLKPLFKHELDMPALSTCGYVTRSLRPGYVLAYYEKSHTPQLKAHEGWEVFKVYPGGYMEPFSLEGGPEEKEGEDFTCSRVASYATAMLLVIQDAKRAGKVWVAYSDHVWSKKVRDIYQSDKGMRRKRMTRIDATKAKCDQSIPLNENTLQQLVAEYDPQFQTPFPLVKNPFIGNPFEPLSFSAMPGMPGTRPDRASDMHATAQSILATSNSRSGASAAYPPDAAMIVGVTDAIGVTCETAHRRITLCNTAADWVVSQPDGYHRFQSAMTIEGLLKLSNDRGTAKKAESTDPKYAGMNGREVRTAEFERLRAAGKIPQDATLSPIYAYNYDGVNGDGRQEKYGWGTIRFVSNKEIDSEVRDLREDILDGLSGKGDKKDYRNFLDTHASKAKQDAERLTRIELDYRQWLLCDQRKLVTAHDFDETTPSDGIHYAGAVAKVTFGGPITDNGVAWFQDFLLKDPNDKEALLVRALLGNQTSAFAAFKPTKNIKQVKTFFKLIEEIDKAVAANASMPPGDHALSNAFPEIRIIARQLPLLRNLASLYGHMNLGVFGATVIALDKLGKIDSPFRDKAQRLVEGISDTLAARANIALHKLSVPIDVGARYWRKQLGHVRELAQVTAQKIDGKQIKSLVLGGAMWFDITGRPGASGAVVDIYIAVRSGSGQAVGIIDHIDDVTGEAAAGAVAATNKGADAVELLARTLGKGTNDMVRTSMQVFKQGGATLSAAGGVLQVLAIGKAWHMLKDGDADERARARISLISAGLGLTGAMLEIGEAFAKQLEKTAAQSGLKVLAGAASTVVLIIDSGIALVQTFDEHGKGDVDAAAARAFQTLLFAGAAVASGLAVVSAAGTAGWITVTVGAGWGLSWTGWGFVLVGLGLIAGWVAMMLDDAPTVEWVKGSIWGTASSKYGSLQSEQNELNKILLGVRVEFSAGVRKELQMGATSMGAPMVTQVSTDTYEASVRLFAPKELLAQVKFELGFSLVGSPEQRKTWQFRHEPKEGGGTREIVVNAPGMVNHQLETDEQSVTRRMEVDRSAVRGVRGLVLIWDAPADGELIVEQALAND